MTLDCVAAHSIFPDLLRGGGWVLDAGCRDFVFAKYAAERGCHVLALDPDPEVRDPGIAGVTFVPVALAHESGVCDFALTDELEARHLASANSSRRNCPYIPVPVASLADLMRDREIDIWDCVKMDIEGSEYEILLNWPGPIARQITVEFHDHVEKRAPEIYDRICDRLGQWYEPAKWYAGDTLFVLKSLAFDDAPIGNPWWRP